MKRLIREFLFLRKQERLSLSILSIFMVLTLVLRTWLTTLPARNATSVPFVDTLLTKYLEEGKIIEESAAWRSLPRREKEKQVHARHFDPNTVSKEEMLGMHFPGRVANNIIAYREAGGSYRSPEDLLKLYAVDSSFYYLISSFIIIGERENGERENGEREKGRKGEGKHGREQGSMLSVESTKISKIYTKEVPMIELNSADSSDLILLPGIGPSYAHRIVAYRNLLGGFYSQEQLLEVYGMDSSRYEGMKSYINVDSTNLVKIALADAEFRDFISHPYLDKKDTYALLQLRDFLDGELSLGKIRSNAIFPEEKLKKIAHYLE